MESNANRDLSQSKELRCRDCGYSYSVAVQSLSSSCPKCGNIEFLSAELPKHSIIQKRVLQRLQSERLVKSASLDPFKSIPEGRLVAEIQQKYQVEWQLWAAVVKHFSEPEYHAAYLTTLANTLQLDKGILRYQSHSLVMAGIPEDAWQSEICDLMLQRIRTISIIQCERGLSRSHKDSLFPKTLLYFALFMLGLVFFFHLISNGMLHHASSREAFRKRALQEGKP